MWSKLHFQVTPHCFVSQPKNPESPDFFLLCREIGTTFQSRSVVCLGDSWRKRLNWIITVHRDFSNFLPFILIKIRKVKHKTLENPALYSRDYRYQSEKKNTNKTKQKQTARTINSRSATLNTAFVWVRLRAYFLRFTTKFAEAHLRNETKKEIVVRVSIRFIAAWKVLDLRIKSI